MRPSAAGSRAGISRLRVNTPSGLFRLLPAAMHTRASDAAGTTRLLPLTGAVSRHRAHQSSDTGSSVGSCCNSCPGVNPCRPDYEAVARRIRHPKISQLTQEGWPKTAPLQHRAEDRRLESPPHTGLRLSPGMFQEGDAVGCALALNAERVMRRVEIEGVVGRRAAGLEYGHGYLVMAFEDRQGAVSHLE